MRSRWWRFWTPRRSDEDFAEEVESHIAMEVDRPVATGLRPEVARTAARRAFGNVGLARERFHDARRGAAFESLGQDIRFGWRTMRRAPLFTAVAVASLAVGIGVNTTMFGAIDTLLLRAPAQVRDAKHLHRVYLNISNGQGDARPLAATGYRTYLALRDRMRDLDGVAAFDPVKVSSGHGADARLMNTVLATPGFFTVLGTRPALGRFFLPNEEREDTHVAVLSYDTWRSRFVGDSTVLGRTIDVAGLACVIVGVAPEGFTGADLDRVDLWLPLAAATRLVRASILDPDASGYWLQLVVRTRPDASIAALEAQLTQIERDLHRDSPRFAQTFAKSHAVLGPLVAGRGLAPTADARVSVWVAAVSLLVLLIASANVANLLLLRGLMRSRDTAVRLSLGAGRVRLARQCVVEGLMLAAAGAVCAIVLARWSAAAMQRFLLPNGPDASVVGTRTLIFTLTIAIVAGLLASLIPAFVTARRDFGPLLGGRDGGARHRLVVQRAIIAAQVGLATLLLVGAGLFTASLRNVRAIDLGVDVDHVLFVGLDPESRYRLANPGTVASENATYLALLERIRRLPGVVRATVTSGAPLAGGTAMALRPAGAPPLANGSPVPYMRAVGTEYFETMGTPLRRGRLFSAADHGPNAHVGIVDEETARHFWPDGTAVGACAFLGSDETCTTIVGVVANTIQYQMTGSKGFVLYLPLEFWGGQVVNMLEVRTAGDPRAAIPMIRQAVVSASPDLPWVDIHTLREKLDPQLRPWRLGASMFTLLGVLALCLAAIGLYGLLSYVVAQRTREIGVRRALGAPTSGLVGVILRRGLVMTLVGLAIGGALALGAGRLIASQLYGVSPHDPVVFLLCAGVLLVVTLAACIVPASRAARIDPMIALRAE